MSGVKVATAQSHSFPSGALSFISCTSGRESLPLDENDSPQPADFKTETKKKKFRPLRNLRRMFRRKARRSSITADSYQVAVVPDNPEIPSANLEQRSCSTSRLQEENSSQNFAKNNRLNPGLSLSHDSIFTPDRADSGLSSSDLGNSSLSITVLTPSRECAMKSPSSCSETSLLSIGSSEVELSPIRNRKISDLDLGVTSYKLSHSAAKHKMAVKPRRNHGAPRSRRKTMTSKSPLPTTIEVSEEGGTGWSSPPTELESPKITWSQSAFESTIHLRDEKSDVPKVEDEHEEKEEEVSNPRAESFFGRFLSRRSEKKKKSVQESNSEEGATEEKSSHFGKKFSKNGKNPNRRQRVEPMEIPSSPCLRKSDKEDSVKKKVSDSSSPPKNNVWMNHVTPRSMSPPATIWQDNGARFAKDEKENSSVWDKTKTTEISLTENVPQDLRHPSFVKELTTSISFFVKDEFGKRKIDEEEEETAQKVRRQHSENETPRKITITADNEQEATKLDSSSATSDTSCTETEILRLTPKEEPSSFGSPFSYEAIHDGYENIQIIELVKQETRISFEEDLTDSEKKRTSQTETEESITLQSEVVDQEGGISDLEKESVVVESVTKEPEEIKTVEEESDSVNKPAPEIVRRVKPVVLQKPKDLKRFATPGFNKTNLSKGELKSFPDEKEEIKSEKVSPKTLPNLVERRKSELMMLTEPLEKDWKAMSKPLKKQSSFKESWTERQTSEEEQKVFKDEIASLDKTDLSRSEASEEVVFRKKVVSGHTDEQPELMKVFARRSLKVRESEKIADDLQRSRDSDKENETNESPKEERKKSYEGEEKKECETEKEGNRNLPKAKTVNEVKVNITPLKPEVTSRKNVFQRYGRSLSENNAKKEEMDFKPFVLEENCLNKMRRTSDLTASNTAKEQKDEIDEEVEEEEEEETGFKRIQQRKAEWERRAQQSAK